MPQVDQLKAIALASGDPLGYLTEPLGLLPIEETQNADWRSVILRIHQLTDDQKQSLVVLINSMVNGRAK